MNNPTPAKRGNGEICGNTARGNMMIYHKTLDDYLHKHVIVTDLQKVGYVWGGWPSNTIDIPDTLFITAGEDDYEVASDKVIIYNPSEHPDKASEMEDDDIKEAS